MAARPVVELARAAGVADLSRASIDADAQGQGAAGDLTPLRIEEMHRLEHAQAGPASAEGVVCLGQRRVPHRQNAVAGVIDDHPCLFQDGLGEAFHEGAHEPAGLVGAETHGQARETAQVAGQDCHVLASALQQGRVSFELANELGGKELLELHARAHGGAAGDIGAGDGCQELNQLRFHRQNAAALRRGTRAHAVQARPPLPG